MPHRADRAGQSGDIANAAQRRDDQVAMLDRGGTAAAQIGVVP